MTTTTSRSDKAIHHKDMDSKKEETEGAAHIMQRKSLLEHLEANISGGDAKTFIYRMTVVGSHEGAPEYILKFKDKLVNDINTACYDECATGFLAVYQNHFMHLLEGSEDTLNKYIQACATEFETTDPEGQSSDRNPSNVRMKILSYVRVFTRSTDKWTSFLRTELGTFNLLPTVHGFRNRLFEFIKKVWILATVIPVFMQPEEVTTMQNIMEFEDPEDQQLVEEATKALENDLDQELNKYFPVVEMLQYFMKPKKRFPPLRTPKEHMERSWNLPKVILDKETVWPFPSRLARYD